MYWLNYTRAALVGLVVGFLPWVVVSVGTVRDPLERAAFSFRIRPAVRQTVATIESFCQNEGLPAGSPLGTGWMRVAGFS